MKEGWEYKKLGEVCEILDSQRKPITKSKRDTGSIPYYGATGLLDYVKDYIFDEKLVLLGEDGAKWNAGENSAYIIEGKSWVNNHAHALRPKRNILIDELLVYYLNFSNLLPYITGVTVPKLNQEKMRSIEIPIGPVKEQQAIVDYLDSAFAKIDAMKANASKALDEAKALFQASLKEMLEPKEGWDVKKIGAIADIKGGKRLPKGDKLQTTPTKHPYIRVADFNDIGTIDTSDIHYISDSVHEQIKRYIIKKEDIYISIAGTIGKSGIIPDYLDGANLTENACRLILSNTVYQRYVYYFTISSSFIKQINERTKKSAQPKLALTRLSDVIISYPPINEQQAIVASLDSIKDKIERLQANYDKISQECDSLKQALLRQVFE